MNKSDEFDEKEKKLEEGPEEMLKRFLPLINSIFNKPKTIQVRLDLQPYQLADLAELAQKWAKDCPDMVSY